MQSVSKTGLWRRTPPAVFPPILGLFGLGLAWRQGTEAYFLPRAVSEMILGAVVLLYGFCLTAYLYKMACRPAVILDEAKNLPGRAGLAAMSLSVMAMALVLEPYNVALAHWVLGAGLVLHLAFALVIIRQVLTAPAEQRPVTPLWHLHFVGFILGAVAAVRLGMPGLATGLMIATLPVAILIWGASARQVLRAVPPPMRPLLAIHLAPASLFATVSAALGYHEVALVFAVLALALFAGLVAGGRWLCAAGFTPLWGAFTFPVAAFAVAMMEQATPRFLVDMMGFDPAAPFWRVFGAVALVVATISVPYIAARVLQRWAKGILAAETNAAVA